MASRILLVVLVALLAACAGDDGAPDEAAAGEQVSVSGFAFQPETLTIDQGATVTWSNSDDVPHTATAEDGSFNVSLSAGGSGSHTFDESGSFAYACTIHPPMTAEVTVN
jgi:plastocyanin